MLLWPGAKCIFNIIILGNNAGVAVYFRCRWNCYLRGLFARLYPSCICVYVYVHRNAKCPFVCTLPGSFDRNIAVSRPRFYSRVNPAENFLILQWRRVNVKPLDVLDQSSTAERFLVQQLYKYWISLRVYRRNRRRNIGRRIPAPSQIGRCFIGRSGSL